MTNKDTEIKLPVVLYFTIFMLFFIINFEG